MKIDAQVLDQLTDLQRRFLSVSLDRDRIENLLAEIGALVDADAAFAAWLDDGRPWLVAWRAGPQIEAYMAETFAGVDAEGNIRCRDPDLDALNRKRRGLGSGVYHEKALAARDRITDTVYFREAFEPAGMPQVIGMTARLSVGEAIFAFGFHAPGARGFVGGETEAILQLLLPSFEAGFHAIDRRNRHRERLEKAIRASPLPAHLLESCEPPDPEALLQLPLPEIGAGEGPVPHLWIGQIDSARLSMAVAESFGLTPRQREVTELLLDGHSTRAISIRLGLTYNTGRRHCEAILQKTGATRREQLGAIAKRCIGSAAPRARFLPTDPTKA